MREMEDCSRHDHGKALAWLLLLIALGVAGAWYWMKIEKDRIIAEQQRVIKQLGEKLDRAWAEELAADVRVDSVTKDAAGRPEMHLTFVQYERGTERSILKRSMTLPGSEFYIDALVVKFERKFVDVGDGLRGKSLLVFRRAFGDLQNPSDGVPLYRQEGVALIPEAVQVDAEPSPFEQDIWARFWDYAGDPKRAEALGIRVAQGEAPHMKAVAGQVYKLTLRSSGGLDIQPRLPTAVLGGAAK